MTTLRETFGGEVPSLVQREINRWHAAIAYAEDQQYAFVLDVSRCPMVEEVSRKHTVGIVHRVHRRIAISRGIHDVLEHCSSCFPGIPNRLDDDDWLDEDADPFDFVYDFCNGRDGYDGCDCDGLPKYSIRHWGQCWMDLWTEEWDDGHGIGVSQAEAWVSPFGSDYRWCIVDEERSIWSDGLEWLGDAWRVEAHWNHLCYDYEDWDKFRDSRTSVLYTWWQGGGGEKHIAEWARRRDLRRRAEHRQKRLSAIENRREQHKIRFGVPWNVHTAMRKEGYFEWSE